ncbi:MAG: hypothetical protein ACKPDI_04600 [Actinomycetota bacterium]
MRWRGAAVAVCVIAASVASGQPQAWAAPAGCKVNSKRQVIFCDHTIAATGIRGGIALVGDSVFLGSSPGMSNPGLPALLSAAGWGPVRMTTSLGMVTFRSTSTPYTLTADSSGYHILDRWKAQGLSPRVVAVNLGANHLGTCTTATVATCRTAIAKLLDRVAANFPNASVWWAKTNHETYGRGTGYSAGMLGWNLALDLESAARTNLVVWDWPTALRNANPSIRTDTPGVHPSSGVEYVKRSTMIADHLGATMNSVYTGPRVPLPTALGDPLPFRVMPATSLYDTTDVGAEPLAAGQERVIELSSLPPGTQAVAVGVTGTNATAGGFLTLYRCGDTRPSTSNLNVQAGVIRSAQALVAVTTDLRLCAWSSVDLDIALMLQGVFAPSETGRFSPITPLRAGDTRNAGRSLKLTVPVPPSDAVAVSLTVIGGDAAGTATLYPCDASIPTISHLQFRAGEVVAVAAFVPVSGLGTICVHADTGSVLTADAPHLIVDVTGIFGTTGLRFAPVPATRLLDTRSGIGGWQGRPGRSQTIDVQASPGTAGAVSGVVTMVQPLGGAHVRGHACGATLPETSAVNSRRGLVAANTLTTAVTPSTGLLCLWSSAHAHVVFDVVGWWVP